MYPKDQSNQFAQQFAPGAAQQPQTIKKPPVAEVLVNDSTHHLQVIGRHLMRIESVAERILGECPPDQTETNTESPNPTNHVSTMMYLVAALARLEERLRTAADRLEQFI